MYDDRWTNNMFAVTDEQLAKATVENLTSEHERLSEVYSQICKYTSEITRTYQLEQIPLPPKPKGPAHTTKELMSVYHEQVKEWNLICKPIQEENSIRYTEYYKMLHSMVLAKFKEMNVSDEDMKSMCYDGSSKSWPIYNIDKFFSYEELELKTFC